MAYIPGFDCDIFISYAHDDNMVLPGETAGWVTQFRDYLENWLVRRRGLSGLNIWFDQRDLRGSMAFDTEIREKIEGSALFFALHSHNYQKSDYCKQELEWFLEYQRQRGGIRFNNDSRLFNILLNNIHHEQWLPAFAGVGCFPLHDAPEKSQEFGQPIAPDGFGTHLRKLEDNTADLLGALREAEAASPVREAPPTTDRPRVFIAHVADTLKPFRQRLISEISAQA
ncbi:MAG: toll/interleukin-1 receptor domain-containing protein [Thiolinea sp.]